jgi:dipeptidyl-peptidase-3
MTLSAYFYKHGSTLPATCNLFGILTRLIQSFETGSMGSFKKYQELWVQDTGPDVESAIGFNESYQDPHGVRASWQGFVAISNKSQAEIYQQMLDAALEFIHELLQNSVEDVTGHAYVFENPVYKKSDLMKLDALAYSASELFSGLNLPNVGFSAIYNA